MARIDQNNRKTAGSLALVLFLVALAPGLLGVSATLEAVEAAGGSSILDGSWSALYEEAFAREHPIRDVAVTVMASIRYGLFREGHQGVLVGTEQWLFTAEEYEQPGPETAVSIDDISHVAGFLWDRGIPLIVAIVPAKSRVYSAYARQPLPDALIHRYDTLMDSLEALGIPAPDLRGPLNPTAGGEKTFFATDTHWTPFGAEAVASAVAQTWRSMTSDSLPASDFVTEPQEEIQFDGDLVSFLDLGALRNRLGPPTEEVIVRELHATVDEAIGLFGAVSIPVAAVGTSYTADPRWGFESALKEALQSDVLTVASEGNGPLRPMEAYLSGETIDDIPPDLVIWEIPERYVLTN